MSKLVLNKKKIKRIIKKEKIIKNVKGTITITRCLGHNTWLVLIFLFFA